MTMESTDQCKFFNQLIGTVAYQTGIIQEKIQTIKENINLNNTKEALTKLNEVLKFIETRMIPLFKDDALSNLDETKE